MEKAGRGLPYLLFPFRFLNFLWKKEKRDAYTSLFLVPLTGLEPVRMLLRGILSYSAHCEISGTCEKLKEDIPRKYDVFYINQAKIPKNRLFQKSEKKLVLVDVMVDIKQQ